jgi:heavy metal sensor kinase
MKRTLRALVFRYMLAVIIVTAVIRLGVWLAYQAYEIKQGHVVFHEQIGEMLLLLLVEVLALAILGFMLWRLSRMLLSPLRSVANAASLIAQGKLGKRIRTRHLPPGELLEIAEALNNSFDRYQDAIDRISRFSSAASHQLRTPLTAMRATAELSLAQARTKEEHEQALVSILEEVQHLTRMTEQLLLLSRMEVEHLREDFKATDLNPVVRRVVDVYQPVVESKEIQLQVNLANSCPVHGDETLLLEAVMNLLDNAAKWSPQGGRLTVTTTCRDGTSALAVSDSGPGIDPAFRYHLFERFARHPAAPYKGSGLGLSIVSEVVRLHGGRIEFDSNEHGGATFRLSFPAADAPDTPRTSPSSLT